MKNYKIYLKIKMRKKVIKPSKNNYKCSLIYAFINTNR